MSGLFALDTLVERLKVYVARHELKHGAFAILDQVLAARGAAAGRGGRVTGLRERRARDLLASLVADGILASDTPKGPSRYASRSMRSRSCSPICSRRRDVG